MRGPVRRPVRPSAPRARARCRRERRQAHPEVLEHRSGQLDDAPPLEPRRRGDVDTLRHAQAGHRCHPVAPRRSSPRKRSGTASARGPVSVRTIRASARSWSAPTTTVVTSPASPRSTWCTRPEWSSPRSRLYSAVHSRSRSRSAGVQRVTSVSMPRCRTATPPSGSPGPGADGGVGDLRPTCDPISSSGSSNSVHRWIASRSIASFESEAHTRSVVRARRGRPGAAGRAGPRSPHGCRRRSSSITAYTPRVWGTETDPSGVHGLHDVPVLVPLHEVDVVLLDHLGHPVEHVLADRGVREVERVLVPPRPSLVGVLQEPVRCASARAETGLTHSGSNQSPKSIPSARTPSTSGPSPSGQTSASTVQSPSAVVSDRRPVNHPSSSTNRSTPDVGRRAGELEQRFQLLPVVDRLPRVEDDRACVTGCPGRARNESCSRADSPSSPVSLHTNTVSGAVNTSCGRRTTSPDRSSSPAPSRVRASANRSMRCTVSALHAGAPPTVHRARRRSRPCRGSSASGRRAPCGRDDSRARAPRRSAPAAAASARASTSRPGRAPRQPGHRPAARPPAR